MTEETPENNLRTVTPYLIVPNVGKLLNFLHEAFDAIETERHAEDDGRIIHAQVLLGDSVVMMGEPTEQWKAMPASIYLRVQDCGSMHKKAIECGAKSIMEPADQEYGERMAGVEDLSGNRWWLAQPL